MGVKPVGMLYLRSLVSLCFDCYPLQYRTALTWPGTPDVGQPPKFHTNSSKHGYFGLTNVRGVSEYFVVVILITNESPARQMFRRPRIDLMSDSWSCKSTYVT